MGYVEPHSSYEDPFANCSDVSDSPDSGAETIEEDEDTDPSSIMDTKMLSMPWCLA